MHSAYFLRSIILSGFFFSPSHYDAIFEKFTAHKICVLSVSTMFTWKICHSKKNLARYCHKSENVFMFSTRYSCWFLMKLELFLHMFEKSSNIKFQKNFRSLFGRAVWQSGSIMQNMCNNLEFTVGLWTNYETLWSAWSVAGCFGCTLTSIQQPDI